MMKRIGSDRQVRYARILGLTFIVLAFVAMFIGWRGMARVACADCQLPYLVSAGATGIGLTVVGGALLLMAQFRAERMALSEQVEHMGSLLASQRPAPSASGGADGQVVVGQSTYHRPGCRLIEGKAELDYATVEVARSRGLSPCRVCTPAGEDAPSEQVSAVES